MYWLFCLDCVLRVIVLLEGEPSAQSEVLSALDQVFIENISVLCTVQLSFKPDQIGGPIPASVKPSHSMMLPPPCFTAGMVLGRWWVLRGFPQTWRLELWPTSSVLVSSDQRILFLTGWESFGCFFFPNSKRTFLCLSLRGHDSIWPLCHKTQSDKEQKGFRKWNDLHTVD